MRRTILLLATIALALMVAGGVALAAPGAPTVVSTVPPTGATTFVDSNANIKAKFSEAMKGSSINTSTFYLYQGHFTGCPAGGCVSDPVAATVRYNADTRTAILDPVSTLLFCTEHTAVVEGTGDGDMVAVKDRGGTPMASDYIFYFKTTAGPGGGSCRP
jgi:Bacterial Ig-like domain